MTINWKIWASVGIVAVVALVMIGFNQFGTKAPQTPIIGETSQTPVVVSVDDAVSAISAGITDDQALFADAEKDTVLVTVDSQAISDFGQSYNENEF